MTKFNRRSTDRLNVPASDLPHDNEPKDFRRSFNWRVFRIMAEFINGWQFLADFNKTVTFFGSARIKEGTKWYEETRKLGKMLANKKFAVITGGGPGIMEAANRGAFESKSGNSVGIDIELPFEQRQNPYVKRGESFYYFFVRKVMLAYSAQAYVFFPGGFGTLDELFEMITLIQTKKIARTIPVVLVGKDFWTPMLKWIDEAMIKTYKTISPDDIKIYTLVDTAEEAFRIINKAPSRHEFDEFISSHQ